MPIILQHRSFARADAAKEWSDRSPFSELIVVVPTRRRIRHLSREVLSGIPGAVSPALPFHTLETFARSIYSAMEGARASVSGPVQTLLFHDATQRKREALGYFRFGEPGRMLYRGTFEKIIGVVTNLKESGVYPDTLEEELVEASLDERQKLRDIITIYRAYEEELEAIEATDTGGLYRTLHAGCTQAQFKTAFRSLYPQVHTISLAGFDEFTVPELGFIRKLCATHDLSVFLLFDFESGNRSLFGHLEENFNRFTELGFTPVERTSAPMRAAISMNLPRRPPGVGGVADSLARTLFNPDALLGKQPLSDRISLLKAATRQQEVTLICKLIKQLVAEKPGRDLSAICIAMFRPQPYTDLFREQLNAFGIPANITDRFSLSRSPVVNALLGLLQIPMNGFRRDDVLRSVSSPLLDFSMESRPLDGSNLAEVSRLLRITRGYRAWVGSIDAALRSTGGKQVPLAGRRLHPASLEKARRDITRVYEVTSEIAAEGTPGEFRARLHRMAAALGLPRRLIERGAPLDAGIVERDVRAYTAFLRVVDDMVTLMEFQEQQSVTHSLRDYVEQLKAAVARERYNVHEQFGRGVLVTSIDETRGLSLDVMILAGLVDGEFPAVYHPEVFYSARRQKERELRHVWQNRYLFYQAVTNWADHLYLTYPEKDGDVELVRSSFVDALLKVADVDLRTDDGGLPFDAVLCSEVEALRWCAAHREPGVDQRDLLPSMLHEKYDEVARGISIEESRVESHSLPEFEGRLGGRLDERAGHMLAEKRHATYSISQLETYAQCPFKFFAERLLSLRVPEELEEEFTALEKGNIMHEAFFEFYTQRRDRDLPPLAGCSEDTFAQALDDLTRIVEQKLADIHVPDPFWQIERELILGSPGSPGGLLRAFLEFERDRKASAEPRYFEVAFGEPRDDPGRTDRLLSRADPVTINGIRTRGRVDRVETGDGFFTIVDYKTGKRVPGLEDIRSGISLQLPLYLSAIEHLLGGTLRPAGGVYLLLRDEVRERVGLGATDDDGVAFVAPPRTRSLVKSREELRALMDGAADAAGRYIEGISNGEFPLTAVKNIGKVCAYCGLRKMCRIQTLRHVQPKTTEDG